MLDEAARHVRANYGAKLSMIDRWFGRIIDRFDEQGLWDDTALVVCTDHGQSMVPLLTGEADAIREWALGGYCSLWVQVTDGTRKYARGSVDDNFPLSM